VATLSRDPGAEIDARAVIAEDELGRGEELQDTLVELWPGLDVVALAGTGVDAIRAIDAHEPDIVFLDIEMPGVSGIDVARYASGRCHVVFVSAYDKYAVAAFDEGAVDYVMKPFDAARIARTVRRLKSRLASAPAHLDGLLRRLAERLSGPPAYARWITAAQGDDLRLITTDEVLYFRADHKCTLVVTADRDSVIYRSIKDLCEALDPASFWQIHRGTIVNVQHIDGISRDFRGRLRVRIRKRVEELPVSAPYAHRFRQM
jgi:DNA-binding LytR/AlgR family response regulator